MRGDEGYVLPDGHAGGIPVAVASPAAVSLAGLDLGPLAGLAALPGLTDLAVDPDGSVWADTGEGMRRYEPGIPLDDVGTVRRLAVYLCAQLGVPLDDAHPLADASTPAGLRLNALLPPLVPEGAAISLRVPSVAGFGLDDLARSGFFVDPCLEPLVRGLVAHHAALLLSGGTGAGKTTFLRALLRQADPGERLVIIEEVRELGTVDHPDVVSLAARPSNSEGKGGIGLDRLVQASLRMRPDRIILGECRGGEAADVLRAFNTGHRGGMLTLHADNIARVPSRLISLARLRGMGEDQARLLLTGAFDAVLHCERRHGKRFLSQIGVLEDSPSGPVGRAMAFCSPRTGLRTLPGWEEFVRRWTDQCDAGGLDDTREMEAVLPAATSVPSAVSAVPSAVSVQSASSVPSVSSVPPVSSVPSVDPRRAYGSR